MPNTLTTLAELEAMIGEPVLLQGCATCHRPLFMTEDRGECGPCFQRALRRFNDLLRLGVMGTRR